MVTRFVVGIIILYFYYCKVLHIFLLVVVTLLSNPNRVCHFKECFVGDVCNSFKLKHGWCWVLEHLHKCGATVAEEEN